jgi:hypothetical protein
VSAGRKLQVRWILVAGGALPDYLTAAAALARKAAGLGGNFWLFEVDGWEGTFVEFIEAADVETLETLEREAAALRAFRADPGQPAPAPPAEFYGTEVRLRS